MCFMCDNTNGENAEAENHPEGCACGQVTCPNLTLKQVMDFGNNLTIRVLSDEDDGLYIHEKDIGTALIACARVQELANQEQGVDPNSMMLMNTLHQALIFNVHGLLTNTDKHVDLSAQSVPDSIPDDWKTAE